MVATNKAGQPLLVMVFQEIEHVCADVVGGLPLSRDGCRRLSATNDIAQAIIHAHFVVEIVEPCL